MLSKNLSMGEFIKSDTAMRLGIDNRVPNHLIQNANILASQVFQPIREHFGTPIFISSGYRSDALNKAIGGSTTSAHSFAAAIDIDQDFRNSLVSNEDIFDFILNNLSFDQLIAEIPSSTGISWVHVGMNKTGMLEDNRNQVLIYLGKGKYIGYTAERLRKLLRKE